MRDWRVERLIFFFFPVLFAFYFINLSLDAFLFDSLFQKRSIPGHQLPRKKNHVGSATKKLVEVATFATREVTL